MVHVSVKFRGNIGMCLRVQCEWTDILTDGQTDGVQYLPPGPSARRDIANTNMQLISHLHYHRLIVSLKAVWICGGITLLSHLPLLLIRFRFQVWFIRIQSIYRALWSHCASRRCHRNDAKSNDSSSRIYSARSTDWRFNKLHPIIEIIYNCIFKRDHLYVSEDARLMQQHKRFFLV